MLRKRLQQHFDPIVAITVLLVLAAILALCLTIFAPPASAGGGIGTGPVTVGGKKAKLLPSGKAIPPEGAPSRVKKAIAAANKIRKKPYVWGGGHGNWNDKGYDCSGAVSYMLHGGRMLNSPLDSGSLASSWGTRGKGRWITVYANGGHTYAVVAGLRWDTSMTGGNGPRWSKEMRSARGFAKRHYAGA